MNTDGHVDNRSRAQPREIPPPELWARLELQCEVNSVGPSDYHEELAQVVLSVPPADDRDAPRAHEHALADFNCLLQAQMPGSLTTAGGGNGSLAVAMRWFLRALASGQVRVLTTGDEASARTEPDDPGGTDMARMQRVPTGPTARPTIQPSLSRTQRHDPATLNAQLVELRELNEKMLALVGELLKGPVDGAMTDSDAELRLVAPLGERPGA